MGFRGEQLRYLIVGIITTAINTGTFWIAQQSLGVSVQNMLAWVVGVIFAFIANRVYVFKRSVFNRKQVLKEFIAFIYQRILTGILDEIIVVVGVSLTSLVTPVKVGSNLVVVILNYLLSKYIVWKQGDNKIGQR